MPPRKAAQRLEDNDDDYDPSRPSPTSSRGRGRGRSQARAGSSSRGTASRGASREAQEPTSSEVTKEDSLGKLRAVASRGRADVKPATSGSASKLDIEVEAFFDVVMAMHFCVDRIISCLRRRCCLGMTGT